MAIAPRPRADLILGTRIPRGAGAALHAAFPALTLIFGIVLEDPGVLTRAEGHVYETAETANWRMFVHAVKRLP